MSANPTNILPLRAAEKTPSLDDLVQRFIAAKIAEETASKHRLDVEAEILARVEAREEGSVTTPTEGGFKVTTTGSLTYKADDLEALREITRTWDENLIPIKRETKLDATGCKYLRANRPDLWAQLARVITVKPAKTSVKVGV